MTARDLLQQRYTLPNGDTAWRPSPLVTAAIEGKLLILDGIHRVNLGTLAVLSRYISTRKIYSEVVTGYSLYCLRMFHLISLLKIKLFYLFHVVLHLCYIVSWWCTISKTDFSTFLGLMSSQVTQRQGTGFVWWNQAVAVGPISDAKGTAAAQWPATAREVKT